MNRRISPGCGIQPRMDNKTVATIVFRVIGCGFRLNLHNRRDAEDAEVAQRLETESAPLHPCSCGSKGWMLDFATWS